MRYLQLNALCKVCLAHHSSNCACKCAFVTLINTVGLVCTQCELQHGRQPRNSKVLLERNVNVELTHGDKIGNVGRALGCNLDF